MHRRSRSLTDCSSRYVIQAVDLSKALQQILDRANSVASTEEVELTDGLGRVLHEPVIAPLDLPPFANSAMDGYALASKDIHGKPPYRLTLRGQSLAGHPFNGSIDANECIRITTGAPLPDSTDSVVIQENCQRDGDQIIILTEITSGQNIRSTGHDVRKNQVVAAPGKRLNPFDIGALSACGVTTLSVTARPTVAVFSTGDELVAPGRRLDGGQIFDANRFALLALLERLPVTVEDLGIVPDDFNAIRTVLKRAANHSDLLLTSGGVSVGDADYLRDVVEEIGTIELWRLNLKPGKPLAFGVIGDALFLGLPGNPVSAIVTYLLVASGFGCLFFWAYLSGQFKDIEQPKYRMLEMQDEIEG